MATSEELGKKGEEEDIFKTLSHRIRRDIIKFVGESNGLSFSDIKTRLESIDSPSLAYHLKSLQPTLKQKENKYFLSDIGNAAFTLLSKTDQSIKISKYQKNFLYAYIITVACYTIAETIVPLILSPLGDMSIVYQVQFVITVISVVNFITIWQLRKRS
jgi:DNA-binding transcriptional ArsR family regulator